MPNAKQNFLVGTVFLASTTLLGIFTIVIKDITLIEGREGSMAVVFNRVSGLERGHKVLASGMEVGRVGDLQLQTDGSVKVMLTMMQPLKLYKDYQIAVRDASALGGKYVDIQVGSQELGEVPLSYLKSEPLDGQAKESLFDDPNLRDALASIKKIAKDIEQGRGTIGLLVTQRELYDNLKEASEHLKEVTAQIRSNQGTIGKLLYESELYDRVNRTVANVEAITEQIREGKGTVGKLVYDDKVYNDLHRTLTSTKKVMDNIGDITDKVKRGEGTVGKLFNDDKLHKQLELAVGDARTMMQEIQKAVQQVNEGKGTLHALLKDEKMAKDLQDTMANIKVVAERLKKGEGTVGKLLADETIYKELQRLVKNFSDSLEDTREQAPISAFTSILFKAF